MTLQCTHVDCRIVDETVKKWGCIDILVNNAALQDKKVDKFEEIGRERLERTFHTNILAYFTIAQHAVKHMQKGSAIINVASVQAYQPEPGILDYACTKVSFTVAGMHNVAVSHRHYINHSIPCGSRACCMQQSTRFNSTAAGWDVCYCSRMGYSAIAAAMHLSL